MMATPRGTWKQQGANTKKDNNGKSTDLKTAFSALLIYTRHFRAHFTDWLSLGLDSIRDGLHSGNGAKSTCDISLPSPY